LGVIGRGSNATPLERTSQRCVSRDRLADLFIARGPPANIRSDNGSEFIATAVQKWLAQVGVTTLYITPASP
jgi:transposase InsO family protein